PANAAAAYSTRGNLLCEARRHSECASVSEAAARLAPQNAAVLYNLARDIGEGINVLDDHPGVVKRLAKLAEGVRSDLGDDLTGARGSGIREPGFVKDAKPLTKRK
ncbi:MAG: hypothetical protein VYB66_02930, partial [Verrucomicrobiota bacterium]|nr:hypothetical protein [Verrucomicrobiota bacterium]